LSLQHGNEIDRMHICFVLSPLHGGECTFSTFIGKLVDAELRGIIGAEINERFGYFWGQATPNRFKKAGKSDCPCSDSGSIREFLPFLLNDISLPLTKKRGEEGQNLYRAKSLMIGVSPVEMKVGGCQ
jgi:hypothetical protein